MELRTSLRYPDSQSTPPWGHQTLKTVSSIVPRLRQTIKTYSEKRENHAGGSHSGSHNLIQFLHSKSFLL